MIMRLRDLIPSACCSTVAPSGLMVRAVHEPFYDGFIEKLKTAWKYLWRDDLVVVQWPKDGEFEQAMVMKERIP